MKCQQNLKVINKQTGNEIGIYKVGLESSLKNRKLIARRLYAILPQLLENAFSSGEHIENTKPEAKPNIAGYENYHATAKIDGKIYLVKIIVDLVNDKTRGRGYYYHQVEDIALDEPVGSTRELPHNEVSSPDSPNADETITQTQDDSKLIAERLKNQDTVIIEGNLDFESSTMFVSEADKKLRANFLKYLAKNEGTRHIPNDDFANSVAILMIKNLVKEIEKGGRYSANAIVGNGYYNGHVLEISSREKSINYGIMLRLKETGKSPSNFKIELIIDKANIFDSVRTLEDLKAIDYAMPIDLDIPYFVKNVLLPIFDKKADVADEYYETRRKRDAIFKAKKDAFIDYFISIGALSKPVDREEEYFLVPKLWLGNAYLQALLGVWGI
jgi:hypothetical protein